MEGYELQTGSQTLLLVENLKGEKSIKEYASTTILMDRCLKIVGYFFGFVGTFVL